MNRHLCGVYYRVERNGKWESICFSDLTPAERERVLEKETIVRMKSLCIHLANIIKELGDTFDIIRAKEEE